MALRLMTEQGDLPGAIPPHPVALTASEITGLLGIFQSMLDRTERNILDRLDANSAGAAERWHKHDEELLANTRRITERFEKLETALAKTVADVAEHHQLAHDQRIASEARIKPLRYSLAWLWTYRRDIVIVLIGIGVLSTFVLDFFTHIGTVP